MTLAGIRAANATLIEFAAPAPPCERAEATLALPGRNLPLRGYAPQGTLATAAMPGLVYFHGGGWVSGGLDDCDALCATLAVAGQCRVWSVAYRIAPEHRFPAAHDDAALALQAMAGAPELWGLRPGRIGVGGDSAGGNLAIGAALRAAQAGLEPALLFLLSPVLYALARSPSRRELARGHLLEETTMELYWRHYRDEGLSPDDPRVAPLRGDGLERLPPTHIHGGECDPLRDEGREFAQKLSGAGVAVRHVEHAGMIHHFYGLGGVIPAARRALAAVGDDLRSALTA